MSVRDQIFFLASVEVEHLVHYGFIGDASTFDLASACCFIAEELSPNYQGQQKLSKEDVSEVISFAAYVLLTAFGKEDLEQ